MRSRWPVVALVACSCTFDYGTLKGKAPGGSGGSDDAGVPVAPDAQPDVPGGGSGGGGSVGGSGGNPGAGGNSGASDTTSSGGAGTGGARAGGGTTNAGGSTTTGGTTSAGGTTTAGGRIASGGTTSAGGTTTAGGGLASGGTTSAGGTTTASGTAPRCSGLAATCGPSGNDSCCKSLLVPGGTFDRSYDGVDFKDPNYPATVDDFYLDKYEITVGRFRAFVNAGMGTQAKPPAAGVGAHPGINDSGWDSTWNANLVANTAALTTALKCSANYQTWTDAAGSNESKPANCLDWYTAFAFCAWDGGRLPTEAEWNYAASGGSEQRYYPWSKPATSVTIDASYAVYAGTAAHRTSVQSLRKATGSGDSPTWPGMCMSGRWTGMQARTQYHAVIVPI